LLNQINTKRFCKKLERNALIGCMSGHLDVLRLTRTRHQSNIKDEYDELAEELKHLQE